MRALVTGGRGFIGGHLCDTLKRYGVEPRVYDIKDGLDVLDKPRLHAYLRGCDVVFDCAGILGSSETFAHIDETIDANIKGTVALLKACQLNGIPMIYLSLKTDWHNPYLITKRAANEFCLAWYEYYQFPVAIVRGLNVYGARQKWGAVQKAVPTFIVKALKGEPLPVNGDGEQVTDQIHVNDLCECLIRAWQRKAYGVEIDAGTGIPTTVNQLAELIIELAQSDSIIKHVPMRPGEPPRNGIQLADTTLMRDLLDYEPVIPLRMGMSATIDWYRQHYQEVEVRC